jgi:hypothetical protein
MSDLRFSFRSEIARALRSDPIADGLLGGLVAAAAVSLVAACVGLAVALLGAGRDPLVERDLTEQGLGPRALRADLRLRTAGIAVAGIVVGLALALVLATLAVGAVRAASTLGVPRPPLVTVVPWPALLAWSLLVAAGLSIAAWLAGAGAGRTR